MSSQLTSSIVAHNRQLAVSLKMSVNTSRVKGNLGRGHGGAFASTVAHSGHDWS